MLIKFNSKEEIEGTDDVRYWFDADNRKKAYAVIESKGFNYLVDDNLTPVFLESELKVLQSLLIVTDEMRNT